MTTIAPDGKKTEQLPPAPEHVPMLEMESQNRAAASGDREKSERKRQPTTWEAWLALLLPLTALFAGIILWGSMHNLWDWQAWRDGQLLPSVDFVTPGSTGRALEMLFAVNLAVQIRWLYQSSIAEDTLSLDLRRFLATWLFDWGFTSLVTGIVLEMLLSVSITFAGELNLSLKEADPALYSAVAALLALSVRRTSSLLHNVSDGLFTRFTD